ncbi:MAG: leucine-rich repeat domain-containing protein [Lachnospiraceae bacterium]|nr:leucine-rich repeat domain-containing protein [Lachnospiraceae bacterium]
MNKEYASTYIEYSEVPNYIEPKEQLDGATSEYFKELGEYTDNGKEYVDSIEPEIVVENSNKTNEKEQKKKKQHRKMLQNMVYTVASVATVAVLTQTAEPDKFVSGSYLSQIVSEQKESIAGVTIVFDGNGELTKEDVEEKLSGYELDGNFRVVIEEGITAIGDSAFAHYDELVRVEIPDSVKIIGNAAFRGCKNLKLEKLTTTGRTIKNNAFSGVSIEEVEISESLVVDRYYTFRGANINQVSFEEGIRVLPAYLFNECDSIEEIRIPDSVTEIGDSAFAYCDNLKKVEIPDSVKIIRRAAFNGSTNLKLEKLTTTGRTIENSAFSGVSIGEVEISESLVVDRYYTFRGANINQVSFEEGISVLPAYLFNECDSIEEVRIPSSVTEIGESAFGYCDNLKAMEIPSGVNQIGRNAFGGCKNLTLSVRAGSYAEQYAIEEEVPYKTY